MRLKEDSDSYRSSSIKRRDFRHVKDEPEVPPYRAKRKSKRWCKGRVGVEHVENPAPVVRQYATFTYTQYVCSICHRTLRWHSGLT